MEIYTGIDIVEIERFREVVQRHGKRFLKRVYTERETATLPQDGKELYLCFSFSFKESVWKSLPDNLQKDVYFKDIEILWKGKTPGILFKGEKKLKMVNHFFTTGGNAVTLAILFFE